MPVIGGLQEQTLLQTRQNAERMYTGMEKLIANYASQMNKGMMNIPTMPMNKANSHEFKVITDDPEITEGVRINKGTKTSRASQGRATEQSKEYGQTIQIPESVWKLGGTQLAYEFNKEVRANMNATDKAMARDLFYADQTTKADDFNGFMVRLDDTANPRVISHSAVTTRRRSIVVASWDINNLYGIYPAGYPNAMNIHKFTNDKITKTIGGEEYSEVGHSWQVLQFMGLACEDPRYMGRASFSLDDPNLVKNPSGTSDIFLVDEINEVMLRIQDMCASGAPAIYMSRSLFILLEAQVKDYRKIEYNVPLNTKGNMDKASLNFGRGGELSHVTFAGVPVYPMDAMEVDEPTL